MSFTGHFPMVFARVFRRFLSYRACRFEPGGVVAIALCKGKESQCHLYLVELRDVN